MCNIVTLISHQKFIFLSMDILRVLIFIIVLISCNCARQCKHEDCNGQRGRPRKVECHIDDVPEDGKIISMEILEQRPNRKCILHENYGFKTRSIWVSNKCSAEFTVCFLTDVDDDVTNDSNVNISSTTTSFIPSENTKSSETVSDLINTATNYNDYSNGLKTERYLNTTQSTKEASPHHDRGLTPSILGATVGGLVFIILVTVVVVVIIKRCPYCNKKQNHRPFNARSGHKHVTSTVSQLTQLSCADVNDGYDTLDMYRENHQYNACSEISKPNTYMTVYDSIEEIASSKRGDTNKNNTIDKGEVQHEQQKTHSNNPTGLNGQYIDLSSRKNNNDFDNECDTNADTDKKVIYNGHIQPGSYKKNVRTSTSSIGEYIELSAENIDKSVGQYNILDPFATGFNKGSTIPDEILNIDKLGNNELGYSVAALDISKTDSCSNINDQENENESSTQYNILDPSETGFQRGVQKEYYN